jgi:hypothetical protein
MAEAVAMDISTPEKLEGNGVVGLVHENTYHCSCKLFQSSLALSSPAKREHKLK